MVDQGMCFTSRLQCYWCFTWCAAAADCRALYHEGRHDRMSRDDIGLARRLRARPWTTVKRFQTEQHDAFSVFRRRVRTAVLGVTLLTVVSGCAARGRSFSTRFVKPGDPSTSFDAPGEAPKSLPNRRACRATRVSFARLQANARTTISLGSTIESHDPVLASALLKLKMLPTAANHREVARAYTTAGITDFAYRHYLQALQIEPCDSGASRASPGCGGNGVHRTWHWVTPIARCTAGPVRPVPTTRSAPCCWRSASGNRQRRVRTARCALIAARRSR